MALTRITNNVIRDSSISASKLTDNSIVASKFSPGAVVVTNSMLPTGSVLQVVRNVDDTVSASGSGAPNYTYWITTYITLQRANSLILIEGVFTGQSGDDTSVFLQYNINDGGWNLNNVLNSQSQTYSGIGDLSWAHKSNDGPFPFPISNSMSASQIGAGVGTKVGVRVGVINENGITYYNRGTAGVDGSVNFATARSRMTLWEVAQ
jgi:hypothetical protein